jgi:hypothetical protein
MESRAQYARTITVFIPGLSGSRFYSTESTEPCKMSNVYHCTTCAVWIGYPQICYKFRDDRDSGMDDPDDSGGRDEVQYVDDRDEGWQG